MAANPPRSSSDASWPGRQRKEKASRTKKPQPSAESAISEREGPEAKDLAAEIKRRDRRLTALVLALAFLLASFTVRNSDYWMHLATGRALVEGRYTFGTDPFAFTTTGIAWVNHAWLSDLMLYGLSRVSGGDDAPGGALVVILKALLVALLAWVLLRIRRPGQSTWLPAVCVALTLLTLSPHLLLRPTCVSFLFLGVTLWVLQREARAAPSLETRGWRLLLSVAPARLYVLPLLFALWVNLDSWFLLGPLTVGLYLLGEIVRPDITAKRDDSAERAERRALLLTLLIGLLACLLNPHFTGAFRLPPDLVAVAQLQPLRHDALFHSLFLSPFEPGYFAADLGIGNSVAGLTYFVLLGLGGFSFVTNRQDWRGWRLTLWLVFAVLSGLHWRLIPFFAVVAGPITALNLQDAAARRLGSGLPRSERGRRWALTGRTLTLFAGVALLTLAWPGWLQKPADRLGPPRRVAWGVKASPSLRQAAQQIAAWRAEGQHCPKTRGFDWVPDFASYCAWYCPDAKSFFDYRLALFGAAAEDYALVRRTLDAAPGTPTPSRDWQDVFRERQIDHLIFHGNSRDPLLRRLLNDPRQWRLLYLDGRTTILGWQDPDRKEPPAWTKLALDLDPRAFGPHADRAPHDGPRRAAQFVGVWERYVHGPPTRPLDTDEAAMHLLLFDLNTTRAQAVSQTAWRFAIMAGLMATAGGDSGHVATSTALACRVDPAYYPGDSYIGPSAPLLLAVRAARRAVAAQPDDDEGWLKLAETSYFVWRKQENLCAGLARSLPLQPQRLRQQLASRAPRLGLRQLTRAAQTLYALEQARTLRPDAVVFHQSLAEVYWQLGYFDLTLEHLREALRLGKAHGPAAGENGAPAKMLGRLEQAVQELEKQVEDLRAGFQRTTAALPPLQQAQRACYSFGLVQEAQNALRQADAASSAEALELYVYLALTTGRIDALVEGDPLRRPQQLRTAFRQRLDEQAVKGDVASGDFYQAVLSAAVGDYAQAGQALDRVLDALQPSGPFSLAQSLTAVAFDQMQLHPLARMLGAARWKRQIEPELNTDLTAVARQHETQVVRGLLALEEGDTETAARHFRLALTSDGPAVAFESRPIAASYLAKLPK